VVDLFFYLGLLGGAEAEKLHFVVELVVVLFFLLLLGEHLGVSLLYEIFSRFHFFFCYF